MFVFKHEVAGILYCRRTTTYTMMKHVGHKRNDILPFPCEPPDMTVLQNIGNHHASVLFG
jgi:hypothetical protein